MFERFFERLGLGLRVPPEIREGVVERFGFDYHRRDAGSEWLLMFEGSDIVLRLEAQNSDLHRTEHETLALTRPGDLVRVEFQPRERAHEELLSAAQVGALLRFNNLSLEARSAALRAPEGS